MRAVALSLMLLAVSAGAASAAKKPTIPPLQVARAAPSDAKPLRVQFSRVVADLSARDKIGEAQYSLLCLRSPLIGDLYWGDVRLTAKELSVQFERAMKQAGFAVESGADDLFATASQGQPEYEVAAVIKTVRGDGCSPAADVRRYRAYAFVDVEWQVFSRLKREVVFKVQTTGATDIPTIGSESMEQAIAGAFGDNTRALINNDTFRALLLTPSAPAGTQIAATSLASGAADRAPIDLGRPSSRPSGLPDTVGSVVTVLTGGGHGSGFLISDQGYVITNQHVTAGAKTVRLRWSDGLETTGEVLREVKGRDVALIKTEGRGRIPLSLKRGVVPVGTEVYAIGSPIEEAMQGTVTRGIVSASNRILDGYSYIQSDVAVNHGNSGGPLVSKDGDVLGIVVSGLEPAGSPVGVNFFIPAGDALDFLALKSTP